MPVAVSPADVQQAPLTEQIDVVKSRLLEVLPASESEMTARALVDRVRNEGWDPSVVSMGFRALRDNGRIVVSETGLLSRPHRGK